VTMRCRDQEERIVVGVNTKVLDVRRIIGVRVEGRTCTCTCLTGRRCPGRPLVAALL
jgi:hypothetical protein